MPQDTVSPSYLDLGGTIRTQTAQETLKHLQPMLQALGITRVANVTGLDCLGVPVAISIRPNSKHLTVSQGKGLSWELAAVSAIMESIEGFHAENLPPPTISGSYTQVSDHYQAIQPRLFAPGVFDIAELDNWAMDWITAVDISSVEHQQVIIPYTLACLDTTQWHPEYGFLAASSNGLAAGNTLDEAICHALYEIIERDALHRWTHRSEAERNALRINLDTVDSLPNRHLIDQFTAAGQQVKIWDITSELGVPTFHCVIWETNPWRRLGNFRGTGTHLNKEVALSRALTEAAQSRLTLIFGSRDDVFADHYQQRTDGTQLAALEAGVHNYQTCHQPPYATSFVENKQFLCHQLLEQGFAQTLVVDHTKPEFGIPVVHVFIPGMQFDGSRI